MFTQIFAVLIVIVENAVNWHRNINYHPFMAFEMYFKDYMVHVLNLSG